MGAKNPEDRRSGYLIPNIIHIENIEYNAIETEGKTGDEAKDKAKNGKNIMETTGTVKTNVKNASPVKKLSNILNPDNKPLETYILGTQTHVSSFVIQNGGTYYLFDTTGHTHQIQQNGDQYYKSQLIFDKETSLPNGSNIQININPTILNPFGLDYQNGSSACGIWTSNVLAVASPYKNIRYFIMEDKTRHIAMFESEFILKVSANVAKDLSVNPEVKILKQEENLPGYCKCQIGDTLFAINTKYKKNSCLNMESILLSLSQKELEFYNVNHVNDEIIKKRERLIENIKADKAKHKTIINIMGGLQKIKQKTNKQSMSESKLPEKTESELDELNKIESNITKLEIIESEISKLKIAELKRIKSNTPKQDEIELEKIKIELKNIKSNIVELEKAKQEINKLKENRLEQINKEITETKVDEENAQLKYYSKFYSEFTQYFAKTFNIKTPNIIEGVKSYCEGQIKIADNKINHAENTNILYEQLRPLHRQRRAERLTIERYKLARQNQQRLKENSIHHYNEAIIHRGNNSGRSI